MTLQRGASHVLSGAGHGKRVVFRKPPEQIGRWHMGFRDLTAAATGHQWIDGITAEAGLHACGLTRHMQYVEPDYDWQHTTSTLYVELRLALYRYLRSLGLTLDAEDVVQETFFRLVRQLQKGSKIDNVHAWVFQVAYNMSMDIHRANRRTGFDVHKQAAHHQEVADCRSNPEWVYLQKEEVRRVRVALGRLTPRQFRSVQLRVKGFRYREIAADLRVSEQRAIHLVKSALVRLAKRS
jgi:RNA polymerase sigma-70 factor, ECF subfamily